MSICIYRRVPTWMLKPPRSKRKVRYSISRRLQRPVVGRAWEGQPKAVGESAVADARRGKGVGAVHAVAVEWACVAQAVSQLP